MAGRTIFSPLASYIRRSLPFIGGALGSFFGPSGTGIGAGLGGLASSGIHALDQYFQPKQRGVTFSSPYSQTVFPNVQTTQQGPYAISSGIQSLLSNAQASDQQKPMDPTNYGRYTVTGLPDKARAVNIPLRTPKQEALEEELSQMGMGALKNLPSASFGPIKEEYLKEYQEKVLPQLIEQFVSAAPGATRTSGFQQALGSSQAGLQSKLAALQQGFNQQQRAQEQAYGLNLLRPGLAPQFTTGFLEPQPNDLAPLLGSLGSMGVQQNPMIIGEILKGLSKQESQNPEEEQQRKDLFSALTQLLLMNQSQQASLKQ